jgi:hypothetical protein
LFRFISINWAGRPLRSYDILLELVASTTTETGLKVQAHLNPKTYPTGVKITDQQRAEMNIRKHDILLDWNYTIYPAGFCWH